jgi:regulatory protein
LQQELAKRGVERNVADAAIVEVLHDDEVDEAANIERVARKKLRTLQSLDQETRRRRLYAYLARRGYDVDDVRRVVSALLVGSSN